MEIIEKPDQEKQKVSVHIHIPKGHHLHKGFNMKGLKVGGSNHIHLHGKIKHLSEDETGKSMGMDVEDIGEPEEKKSMGDQMKSLRESRKLGRGKDAQEKEDSKPKKDHYFYGEHEVKRGGAYHTDREV